MSSSSYLELLKLKRARLLEVLDLFESGVGERSDFVGKSLCGSDNVSFNHSNDSVSKLSLNIDVELECFKKRLINLRNMCFGKYLVCSAPDCDYKCRFPCHMSHHEQVHHSGEKRFKCRDCKYATNWKSVLEEHQVKKHWKKTGCKKLFVCKFDGCNFRTTLNYYAVEHRRRHMNIKPFKCHYPNCGLSFVRQRHLHYHMIVHVKKKPFRCMQKNCIFATKRLDSLRTHQVTHSTVRAFKCPHNNCTYAAKQRRYLQDHLLSHGKAKPYKCDFNGCSFASKYKRSFQNHASRHKSPSNSNVTSNTATTQLEAKSA